MSEQEESKRISLQVTSLSTQLIESIDKQSQLEEQLVTAKKTIASQQHAIDSYNELKQNYETLKQEYEKDREKFRKQEVICADAEKKVSSLNQEIEDLTASLFDEANNMVADARKEKNSVEILNAKLKEQLKEKDLLLDTLSMQLKNLKNVLYKLENDHSSKNVSISDSAMSSSTSIERSTTNQTSTYENLQAAPSGLLFSPLIQALRYDVPLYTEYLKFLAVLPECETIHQTSSDSKLIKRLVNYEILPVLRLDNASGIGWLTKRNLMNLMMEGLVSIEPISGVNETYRSGYASPTVTDTPNSESNESHLFSRPLNSPPVAMLDPCAFCGENRNDILEHGRLYVFKTYQKQEDGKTEVQNQLPVCHYCLIKLRQVCEIFAFLRSLKSGAWNLEKVTLASIKDGNLTNYFEVLKTSKSKSKSKRLSIFQGFKSSQTSTPVTENLHQFADKNGLPTTNIQRSWARLSQLRASLHWSHIGVWSLDEAYAADITPASEANKIKDGEEHGLGITSEQIPIPLTPEGDETFDFEAANSSTKSTGAVSANNSSDIQEDTTEIIEKEVQEISDVESSSVFKESQGEKVKGELELTDVSAHSDKTESHQQTEEQKLNSARDVTPVPEDLSDIKESVDQSPETRDSSEEPNEVLDAYGSPSVKTSRSTDSVRENNPKNKSSPSSDDISEDEDHFNDAKEEVD